MRIAFMGTPDFALPALRALTDMQEHQVVVVYTQPPRPSGRGHKLHKSPIHTFAETQNIEVRTPKSLKNPDLQADFAALDLDLTVVAAYGLILPAPILSAPRLGCWNLHASLLPRWRGASPIQRTIWAGDAQSGITLMQMDTGLDTGPMLLQRSVPLVPRETAQSLHTKLGDLGAKMLCEGLLNLGSLTPISQSDENTFYAPLLSREDGYITWTQSAVEIDRQIRALTPWPGARTRGGLKILEAEPLAQTCDFAPGMLLDKQGHVACGEGSVLRLLCVQPPGKKAMTVQDALNGGYSHIHASFR